MTLIASLPMYDWPELREATSALYGHVRNALREADFAAPENLDASMESREIWCSDDLLFSQTCGYPYITKLSDAVHLLFRPSYDIEGCGEGTYRSAIVVRRGEADGLSALRGKRLAFNSRDSLSGYRCLSPLIGEPSNFFGPLITSGAHRNSARMVARGVADIAALDAVCWELMQRFEPEIAEQIAVLEWAPEFPSLPFITSARYSENERDAIKQAALAGFEVSQKDERCHPLKLHGLIEATRSDYAVLQEL